MTRSRRWELAKETAVQRVSDQPGFSVALSIWPESESHKNSD
ncbi:hypothetical protein [Alteromonas antoniana]|nr:hypothetical protein [Alteromonas antoniana]